MSHELEGKKVTWRSNRQGGGIRSKSHGTVLFVDTALRQAQVEYKTGPNLRRRFMIDIDRLEVDNGK